MGAALFMLPVNSLRFSGGHARGVRAAGGAAHRLPAAAPAPLDGRRGTGRGKPVYPPGAVSALAIMAASCLTLRGRRPSLERARTLPALACVAVSGIGLLLPRLIGHEQSLITRSQAHALPNFGPGGQMHFFSNSVLTTLKGTYSGLDIAPSLAILLFTPVVLLLLRPRNILLLRRELLWMLATSLLLVCAGLCGAVPVVPSQPLHLSAAALLMCRHRRGLAADLRVAWPPAAAGPGLAADPARACHQPRRRLPRRAGGAAGARAVQRPAALPPVSR